MWCEWKEGSWEWEDIGGAHGWAKGWGRINTSLCLKISASKLIPRMITFKLICKSLSYHQCLHISSLSWESARKQKIPTSFTFLLIFPKKATSWWITCVRVPIKSNSQNTSVSSLFDSPNLRCYKTIWTDNLLCPGFRSSTACPLWVSGCCVERRNLTFTWSSRVVKGSFNPHHNLLAHSCWLIWADVCQCCSEGDALICQP